MDLFSIIDSEPLRSATPFDSQCRRNQDFSALLAEAEKESTASQPDQSAQARGDEPSLEELMDQLYRYLLEMANNPSKEIKQRIREIERKIAELTGNTTGLKLVDTLNKLSFEDEEEPQARPMSGELAAKLGAMPIAADRSKPGLGVMAFHKQNLAKFITIDLMGNLD